MSGTAYMKNAGEGIVLRREQMENYIDSLREKGISAESCSNYRSKLYRFFDQLPDGWYIKPGTLAQMQEELREAGLSTGTVNGFTTVVNGLLDYCGHRELQAGRLPEEVRKDAPVITREEYLRVLIAARSKGKERTYLVIKSIASTGIMLEEISKITVETVQKGYVEISRGRVFLPDFLRKELLDYASRKGIVSEMIFCTRGGKPIDRSNLNHEIKSLAEAANVSGEKCTPRCFRQLYQRTWEKIRNDTDILVEREFARILENEQKIVGWGK